MALTRRFFLGSLASFAAVSGSRAFGVPAGAPRLKLGVLSDIHLKDPGDEKTFITALEYFRASRVDGVLIAGDIADTGRVSQLKLCADAWFKVFPDGKYPDGKVCEQLFVYGNHCILGCGWGNNKDLPDEELIGRGDTRKIAWEKLFHEEYQPIWLKTVNGCPIVGAHWAEWEKGALAKFLEEHRAAIDPALPFVYTQHAHPKDTCMGPWAWGHDRGDTTEILSKFPNCVAFSGHSHYTLTDDRSVWQGAFTSINTSSLKYSSLDYSLRENAYQSNGGGGYTGEKRKHVMHHIDTNDGRQGQIVSFFDDRLEIERREFVYGKSLGPNWIVPFAAGREDFSFAARAAKRTAPEFAAEAKVEVALQEEKDRKLVRVTFPSARPVDGCRPYDYEVSAILIADDVDLVQAQRRVFDSAFYLPEDMAVKPAVCDFAADELPNKGNYRFTVRPIECYGKKGCAIESEIFKLS